MRVEERHIGFRRADSVLALAEAVAFVGKQNVFHRYAVGTHGIDYFVAFNLQHARIVRALHNKKGSADVPRMEQR